MGVPTSACKPLRLHISCPTDSMVLQKFFDRSSPDPWRHAHGLVRACHVLAWTGVRMYWRLPELAKSCMSSFVNEGIRGCFVCSHSRVEQELRDGSREHCSLKSCVQLKDNAVIASPLRVRSGGLVCVRRTYPCTNCSDCCPCHARLREYAVTDLHTHLKSRLKADGAEEHSVVET
eukprot:1155993-Pelagomonas_calceolata.AAC.20